MGTRDATRESIIDAAAGLFLQHGITAVAMGDIATAINCTRRNLYRYFATKEDLVYEVIIRLLQDWNTDQTLAFGELTGRGITKLGTFLRALTRHMEGQKPLLRLMGEFDFVFRDELSFHPDTATAARFAEAAHLTETLLQNIVAEGISDGSIRPDTNTRLIVPTITTVLWGTAQRMAIRDRLVQEEFGMSGTDMILTQIDLYVRALGT